MLPKKKKLSKETKYILKTDSEIEMRIGPRLQTHSKENSVVITGGFKLFNVFRRNEINPIQRRKTSLFALAPVN